MTIDQAFLVEVKRRTSLAELIGAEVALKRAGRELKGLCPFHKERTPSFCVIEAKGFWWCFGCGKHGDAVKWVREYYRSKDFVEAVEYLAHRAGLSQTGPSLEKKPIVQRPAADILEAGERAKVKEALEIWHLTRPAPGTPAEGYWRGRNLRVPIPPTIRFADAIPHPFRPRGRDRWPVMVAAFADLDRKIVGVHCTYLPRPGEAPGAKGRAARPADWPAGMEWKTKIIRGAVRGAAIRLTPAEDVMITGEGIETAASVLQGLWDDELGCPVNEDGEPVGVWVAGSLHAMGAMAVPPGTRELIIAADGDGKIPDADDPQRDDPETILAAVTAKRRDSGITVRVMQAPAGTDFNDLLGSGVMEHGEAAHGA